MLADAIYSLPPAFERNGIKFWFDDTSTDYALCKGLPEVQVFFILHPDGKRMRLVVLNGQPVHECMSIEDVGFQIDKIAIAREFNVAPRFQQT